MKRAFKTPLIFSANAVLIFLSLHSLAQPRGMTMSQVNKQTGQWVMNQQMRFMQQMMMNMHGVTATMQEYDFNVTMRDSTAQQVTSAIYRDSITKKRFIVLVDKRFKKTDTNRYKRIYPSQTRSLTCVLVAKSDDEPGHYLPAVISDSCWMFKTLTGAINVYTFDSYTETGNFDDGAIVGIQLKDGPIVAYTEENLKTMAGDDLEVQQLILEKKYVRAIKKYNRDIEKHKPKDKPETAD